MRSLFLTLIPFVCSTVFADTTLDDHLKAQGFQRVIQETKLPENTLVDGQKRQFTRQLRTHSEVKNVMQIGMGSGHATQHFFQHCTDLHYFVCFDTYSTLSTRSIADYFSEKYAKRFLFVEGNALTKMVKFTKYYPDMQFDLVYIDGNHGYENFLKEIHAARALAYAGALLWVDDYQNPIVEKAISECQKTGLIEVEDVFETHSPSGKKRWVEARYL
jgi:hypothetical protein